MSQPIAITGANGNLGVRLIASLGVQNVRALVRSERARASLVAQFENLDVRVVNYTERESLSAALVDCVRVIHLVGILKEAPQSSYVDAHENSCTALVAALPESVQQVVYLSIVGSRADDPNACLGSKGRAEDILLQGPVPAVVLQVPMVLGEGDYASASLRANAAKSTVLAFRAESLEQPIYAGDVVAAIDAVAGLEGHQRLQLAGPESLPRAELIQRAAQLRGNDVHIVSLPIGLGMLLASVMELLPNPPVTRAMLGVLDHDDRVETENTRALLDLQLTPVDEMLRLTTL